MLQAGQEKEEVQDGAGASFMTTTKPMWDLMNSPALFSPNGHLSQGGGVKVAEFLNVEADRYTKACQNSYLNPHPVPPRTIAARRIAPAMDPIMILVPLGPAQRKEGGRVRRRKRRSRNKTTQLKTHIRGQDHRTSTTSTQKEKRGGRGST